ncbi:MAG: mechanosensitive ion channel, partial [Planctomycetaceae bacterium]|nr:mechanosensitive ion channel [Planctomycetaceae bacterium]
MNQIEQRQNWISGLLHCVAIFLLAMLLLHQNDLSAQETADPEEKVKTSTTIETRNPISRVTSEDLKAKIEAIEKDDALDEVVQSQIVTTYQQAVNALQKIAEYRARTVENRNSAKTLVDRVEEIKKTLSELPVELPFEISDSMDSKQIEQLAAKAMGTLKEFELSQSIAGQAVNQRVQERKRLVELQATHATRLKDVQEQIATAPAANEPAEVTEAVRIHNQLQLEMLNVESEAVKEELNRFDEEKSARFLIQELELWTKKSALQKKQFELIQAALAKKKLEETQRELMELEEEQSIPLLQAQSEEIKKYTEKIQSLIRDTQKIKERQKVVSEILKDVSEDEQLAQNKDRSTAGKSQVFALSLLRQLYDLPDIEEHRKELGQRSSQINEVTYQLFDLRAVSRDLINIEQLVEESELQIQQQLKAQKENTAWLGNLVEDKLEELLIQKRNTAENLDSEYTQYLDSLTALHASQNSLVDTVDNYRNFIRQRIFWIRSDSMIGPASLGVLIQKADYPFTQDDFRQLVPLYRSDLQEHVYVHLAAVIIWLLLLLLRIRAGQELTAIAGRNQSGKSADIVLTLRVFLLTILMAVPGPLLLLFVGWRLGEIDDNNLFREAFSNALITIGIAFAILQFFRQCCRKNGLVESYFNAPFVISTRVRRDFLSFILIILPLFFVVTLLNNLTTDLDRLVLERIFFCAGMLTCCLYFRRVLNPKSQLMREVFLLDQAVYIAKSRWLWYPFATLFPLILAVLAWTGYYYTASQLSWRFLLTIFLLSVLFFGWALAIRWFRIAQRWFHIYVLRARRQQPSDGSESMDLQRQLLEQEQKSDEKKREQQTLRLINSAVFLPLLMGLWFIWGDTMPAIEYLDEISVWDKVVQKESLGADGKYVIEEVREAVSPIDLGFAIFICLVTIGLTRNLPGMIDFSILQRIGLDQSVRYALTSVIGYIVTIVGSVYVFGFLGFRWEQIQWLAAALTFGLSFGLQDIFANFISGLIILFERPIRIGDVVTIEGVTGTVTKIRIRASTITDWDRKEYLVPNKEIITGRLLNWTLSDTLNRVVIPVGVAYGSDTDQVRELLFDIAKQDPEVLDDPSTMVTFEAFGDSTLNFVMRTYLENMNNRMETIHRLHTSINKRFAEAGVEIAFPQTDLHIRDLPAAWNNPVS